MAKGTYILHIIQDWVGGSFMGIPSDQGITCTNVTQGQDQVLNAVLSRVISSHTSIRDGAKMHRHVRATKTKTQVQSIIDVLST